MEKEEKEEGEEEEEEEEEEEGGSDFGGLAVRVGLGFAEKPPHPAALNRLYFPSKLGGSPAWLDPLKLPSGDASRCGVCGDPLAFVLQVSSF